MQLSVQSTAFLKKKKKSSRKKKRDKKKKRFLLCLLYLLLGGEEKDAAVWEGARGSALLLWAARLHQLLGTACCAEPSLEGSHSSPALAGIVCVAWAHLGWGELGLHSLHLPQKFSPGLFSLLPAPKPGQGWLPPSPLLGYTELGQDRWHYWFGAGKTVEDWGEDVTLWQPPCLYTAAGGCGEPLSGAQGTRAEQLGQPSASLPSSRPVCNLLNPASPLPSSLSLTPQWVATCPVPP